MRLLLLTLAAALLSCGSSPTITRDYVELHATLGSEEEVRPVDDFTGIVADGQVQIRVEYSADFRVEVNASKSILEYIETVVEGSDLHIRMRDGYSAPDYDINVKVLMPELERISVDGDCRVEVSKFRCDDLNVRVSGDSDVRLEKISCESITALIEGNSKFRPKGSTHDLSLIVTGDSDAEAHNLEARNTTVLCTGKSEADVYTTGSLNATARGHSEITYKGDPRTVSRVSRDASRIKQKD